MSQPSGTSALSSQFSSAIHSHPLAAVNCATQSSQSAGLSAQVPHVTGHRTASSSGHEFIIAEARAHASAHVFIPPCASCIGGPSTHSSSVSMSIPHNAAAASSHIAQPSVIKASSSHSSLVQHVHPPSVWNCVAQASQSG